LCEYILLIKATSRKEIAIKLFSAVYFSKRVKFDILIANILHYELHQIGQVSLQAG